MDNKINNGDMPAMPITLTEQMASLFNNEPVLKEWSAVFGGMSKREYFAAKAMQGMLSKAHRYTDFQLAEAAVKRADALLKALEANNG